MEIGSLPFEALKKEKERLNTLYRYNLLDSPEEDTYNEIAKVASYICGTPISLISLVDSDRQWFKARVGFEYKETPRSLSFCSHAIQEDGVMEIPDATKDVRFFNNPLVQENPNIRFYAGSPLITSTGHKLGTLCVIDKKPRVLTHEQKECLQTLARQIVAQIELRDQKQQLQQLNARLLKSLDEKLDEQNKVLHLFSRFVPEEIVAKHLQSGGSEVDDAEAKHLTVLFCDIRGYTSLVETIEPRQAVAILKEYYSIMSDVISTYSGMVNQYVGDEIFATFGSPFSFPVYERNAVYCALEMMNQLKTLNEACKTYTSLPIKIGIGIHSGEVVTGTLGSKDKIEYSITGDTVNTGKRVESLTQDHPNTILISKPVFEKVKDMVEVKPWPSAPVKGKAQLLDIYEVIKRK